MPSNVDSVSGGVLTMTPQKPRRERQQWYQVPGFTVTRGLYRWLEREAKANERTIEGQVRFILRNEYAKEGKGPNEAQAPITHSQ